MTTLQPHEELFQGVQVAVKVTEARTEVGSGVLTSAVHERGIEPLSTEALKQSLEPL